MSKKPTYKELEKKIREFERSESKYKLLEGALRESEHKLATHLQNTPIGALSWDLNFKAIEWNQAAENIFGFSKAEAMGKHVTELILPEEMKELGDAIFRDLISEKGGTRSTNENITKDGRRIICEWYNTTLKDATGKIIGVASLVHDITERVKMLKTFKEQKKFNEKIIQTSNAIIVGLDKNHRIKIFNRGAEKITGFKAKEILGNDWFKIFFKPDIFDEMNKTWENSWGAEFNSYVNPILSKTGDEKIISWQSTGVYDNADETKHMLISIGEDITERIQSEEFLKESEKQYRFLAENMADIVWTLDMNLQTTYVSQSIEKVLGFTPEERKQQTLQNMFTPDSLKRVTEFFSLELEFEKMQKDPDRSISIELEYYHKNGTIVWIENNIKAMRGPDGNLIGIYGSSRDITERKQMEEALKKSEKYLKSIFLAVPTGIGVVADRMLKQVNQRMCQMTGYSEKELTGQNARILYPSDKDYKYVGQEKYQQIRDHGTGTVETYWKCKDGRIIDVLLSSTPMDLDDLSKGVTFAALDITEQKRSEESLRLSHERFLTVLDSIDANIYVIDMESYKILFMNKNMMTTFSRDMTGEICWKSFRNESEPCKHCTNDQLIDENGNPAGVCTWQNKNPITGKWYINNDRAIEWSDGRVVKLQISTDITDLKHMEEELRQAQKMESIGTLAGGIAHDFNNIMGIILGNTELALEDVPKWNQAHINLEQIKKAGLRATNIVRQLLSFTRITEQKLQPIEISMVIKDSLKFLRSTIPTTIDIEQDIQITNETILADPTQINQIIMNLCINASHAMEETGGTLNVTVENVILNENSLKTYPELNPGKHVNIMVSDTGTGIDPEIIDRIFDPYFTTKEVGEGSGIGLSVVHGIVKNHNGTIKVDSKPGKGSTFNMLFPLATEKPMTETKTSGELSKGNETILFVDDEISIVKMAQSMIQRRGYKVETATTPQDALDRFCLNPDHFDLVITDMTMPQMTGVKLSEKLLEIRPDIPIIICTGHSALVDEEKAKELGLAAYIMKPISMLEIAQTIRKVLDKNENQ